MHDGEQNDNYGEDNFEDDSKDLVYGNTPAL